MKITNDVKYIGVFDDKIDLFEGQYSVPEGISYNSYVIIDESIAVLDTVEKSFGDEWLSSIEATLDGRIPDYLIVQHMEPDHSANISSFSEKYPNAKIVSSSKSFAMMKQFFGTDFSDRQIIVGDGDTLSLGNHELTFVTAPMVHWPEVIFTYDKTDKLLFSADAFGKFGQRDNEDNWVDEARRYYIGIVGKYGIQVMAALKKTAGFDVSAICPLHGPILTHDLDKYGALYSKWASYEPEENGIVIAYTSVYGNTKKAALLLEKELKDKGENVVAYDLARCDMHKAVADAFRYNKLVLATTTYNGDIFPHMREFILHLTERSYKNRLIGIIENGSWAPMASKIIKGMLDGSKGIEFTETTVTIRSALDTSSTEQIISLANELA